jgi:predicted transposase YdaD
MILYRYNVEGGIIMAGKWDSNLKRLVEANPQEFIGWLVEGAVFQRELPIELNRDIRIDLLYQVIRNGATEIVHIEFQRYEDEDMAWRVLEYNVFATCKYKCPVHSFVIYLRKEGKIAESPLVVKPADGSEIWRFNFTNVKLWEIPTDRFRQMQGVGVLPLLALTREGGRREVVDEAIAGIEQTEMSREKKEILLTIVFNLAALGFSKQEDLEWLKGRFRMYQDIIKDTEIYQIILQEGREEGIEAFHQVILSTVQNRFPELVEMATECVNAVTDLKVLQKLTLDMISANSTDQARALLRVLKKNDQGH